MEFLYTYAVSVGFTLYFGYALISAVDNAADRGLRDWFRRSRMLLLGLGCAVAAGGLGYVNFTSTDAHERWALVLGLAAACGALSTLIGKWAGRRSADDREE